MAPVQRFRVLVVDDNPTIHEDFRQILCSVRTAARELEALEADLFGSSAQSAEDSLNFEIDSAHQGEEAVDLVRAAVAEGRPYALAFVDVRMPPGLDGVETIGELWKLDPAIQAVICTAYSDRGWHDIMTTLGLSDGLLVLRKPFDSIEALQVAHAMTRKWLLSQQVRRRLDELERAVQKRTSALVQANDQLREEVSERRRAQEELRHLATHDSLTGLPNRVLLRDRLEQALARSQRHHSRVGLLLLDVDRFKEVNDVYGHAAGDELLRVLAARVSSAVRSCDTAARMGGDEFVVVLEDLAQAQDAAIVAERIMELMEAPFEIADSRKRVGCSIGVAVYPDDCDDLETLLKSADLAMYQAKQAGRTTYRFCERGTYASSLERSRLTDELDTALERGEFAVWYQPLYELSGGRIDGLEALVRWKHPRLGLVPPMKFIPAAESSGFIRQLGDWILSEACRQLRRWHDAGFGHLSVAVNVSPRQLESPEFSARVREVLRETGLEPHCLELEITETAAMRDYDQAFGALSELHQLGVRLVIDDFGSGYSSLVRLKSMPIYAIKVDRFFVRGVADDARDATIVRTLVALAHSLGMRVVAEGVETAEQLQCLQDMEWEHREPPVCDRVQGFLLSKPLPGDAATRLLQDAARPAPMGKSTTER